MYDAHMPGYLADYADQFRQLGRDAFSRQFRRHALVGIGVVGEIVDGARGDTGTLYADHRPDIRGSVLQERVFQLAWPSDSAVRQLVVGRTTEADLTIPDYSISKRHVSVKAVGPNAAQLTDLASHNGTFLNGQRLESGQTRPLEDGDTLTLGRLMFEYRTPDGFVKYVELYSKL